MGMVRPGPGFGNQPQQPMVQRPPAGGFGGQPPAMGTPFNKPTGPQVQQPMGGYGPGINNFGAAPGGGYGMPQQPGMGQQSSPYDMMQRYQQMMQGLQGFGGQQGGYGMPPQPMGGRRDPFKPLIQLGPGMPSAGGTPPMTQPPMGDGGMPPIGQPMDRQKQVGQGYSPEMQAYYAQDAANQAQRSQMMQSLQGAGQGASPMGQPLPSGLTQQDPMQFGQPMSQMQQQALGVQQPMQSNPMQYQQVMRPPAMPQAPNRQQIAFESPRMQAMRNMQRRGGPKR